MQTVKLYASVPRVRDMVNVITSTKIFWYLSTKSGLDDGLVQILLERILVTPALRAFALLVFASFEFANLPLLFDSTCDKGCKQEQPLLINNSPSDLVVQK